MSIPSLQAFHSPDTLEEALRLLRDHGERALIVAGATFLHGLEARGLLVGIDHLVDLRRLGLNAVQGDDDGLHLGAAVNFSALESLDQVQRDPAYAALLDAMRYPPTQIKNMATLGGSVAASCPMFDLPAALLGLDAELRIQGPQGTRGIPLQQLFAGLFENSLEPGELITEVLLPPQPEGSTSAFVKLETNANDLALVNAAVQLVVDGAGNCTDARVIVGGGIGDSYVRSGTAEQILIGEQLSEAVFAAAGAAVAGDISPMADHRASAEYRTAMAMLFVKRALAKAAARFN